MLGTDPFGFGPDSSFVIRRCWPSHQPPRQFAELVSIHLEETTRFREEFDPRTISRSPPWGIFPFNVPAGRSGENSLRSPALPSSDEGEGEIEELDAANLPDALAPPTFLPAFPPPAIMRAE